MSDELLGLMEQGALSPLSYYFARFVARGSGVGMDSLLAASAALVSARNLQGDVCVDLADYADRALFETGAEAGSERETQALDAVRALRGPALETWLSELSQADWVGRPGSTTPLVLEGTRLYLRKYWRFEQQVADGLLSRMSPVADLSEDLATDLDATLLAQGLERLFGPLREDAVDWQRVAAAVAVTRRFAVISGGPGTGKTTTVVKVLALLLEQNPALRIALAAPTGKAAARLTDAVRGGKGRVDVAPKTLARIPEEAVTLHRLLGAGVGESFRHHRDNPLLLDCLVVDEASMIDLPLMARLLDALPPPTRILLLGDRDQLASVEAGNVLGDITGHGQEIRYSRAQIDLLEQVGAARRQTLPAAEAASGASDAVGLLRVSYRFKADSGIGALSRAMNAGEGEAAFELLEQHHFTDLDWVPAGEHGINPAGLDWAVARSARFLAVQDVAGALRLFEQSRVLAALHRGPFGVDEINRLIAARLQGQALIPAADEYHGKPIMVTANDYEIGLFNGDIGLLWRDHNQALRAYFLLPDDQLRSVPVRQLPPHTCAYALTVHKSQGSEFDEVLLVLPPTRSPVVTRELIYTGLTRARQAVTIHASRETFIEGCLTPVQRTSALAEKLGWSDQGRG
jgi:exodeoxyribonuclease V alpha subunit